MIRMDEGAAEIQPSTWHGARASFPSFQLSCVNDLANLTPTPLVLGMAIDKRSFRLRDKKYPINPVLSISLSIWPSQSGSRARRFFA